MPLPGGDEADLRAWAFEQIMAAGGSRPLEYVLDDAHKLAIWINEGAPKPPTLVLRERQPNADIVEAGPESSLDAERRLLHVVGYDPEDLLLQAVRFVRNTMDRDRLVTALCWHASKALAGAIPGKVDMLGEPCPR